jgi:hypothetical protein
VFHTSGLKNRFCAMPLCSAILTMEAHFNLQLLN